LGNLKSSNLNVELLNIMDQIVDTVKADLDPENDRINIRFIHPDMRADYIDVPYCRPSKLAGHMVFTHISKLLQSQETLATDGQLKMQVNIIKGSSGSGRLKMEHAKGFHDYIKNKHSIVDIKNDDRLCLPRSIVVARGYIQHYHLKTIPYCTYRQIREVRFKKDTQGRMARELCAEVGLNAEDYTNGLHTFGLDEVKLFAKALQPQYGIAVHNSQTANNKVFETEHLIGKENVQWINLLNLSHHFMPIKSPSGFFGTNYWCSLCNKCYVHKIKHRCIDHCVACKTFETDNCLFGHNKNTHCNDCQRDFYGAESTRPN
jgi:hypothetical protein